MEIGTIRKGQGKPSEYEELWNRDADSYELPGEEDSEGSDKEWREDALVDGGDEGPIRRSARKRKIPKFSDNYYEENEDEDKYGLNKKKNKNFSMENGKKKSLKKKSKKLVKKQSEKKKSKDESSGEEGVLIIDDPNSYYDSDEYDSDGKLIRKDEIKRQMLEEERLQRKLKRKPNTPHLVKKYIPVPMNPDGSPIIPIQLRGLTIECMGKVVFDRPKFHAKRYIWPVGFKSTRIYSSMTQLDQKCEYTSEIVDNGEEPGFIVTCWEDRQNPIVISRPTASGAWAEVGKRFFELKKEVTGKDTYTQLSGPEMFGFAHPSIAKLIQEMAGAALCDKYIPQQFVPSSARIRFDEPSSKNGKKKGNKKRKKQEYESESDSDDYEEEEEEADVKDFEAEDAYDLKEPHASRPVSLNGHVTSQNNSKTEGFLEEIVVEESRIAQPKRTSPVAINWQAQHPPSEKPQAPPQPIMRNIPVVEEEEEEIIEESGGVV